MYQARDLIGEYYIVLMVVEHPTTTKIHVSCRRCGDHTILRESETHKAVCLKCRRRELLKEMKNKVDMEADVKPQTGGTTELEGCVFGDLTVERDITNQYPDGSPTKYSCKCICGAEVIVRGRALTTGHMTMCGRCFAKARGG